MEDGTVFMVPHGVTVDGKKWLRLIRLRQVTGHDEQYLSNLDTSLSPPIKTTELLSRVTAFLNEPGQPSHSWSQRINRGVIEIDSSIPTTGYCGLDVKELVRKLTIGDRIALLLHLRQLMFGNDIDAETSCPSCGKVVSLDLSVLSLLQPVEPEPKTEYHFNIDNFDLTIRPLQGRDQEEIVEVYAHSGSTSKHAEQYAESVVRACIISCEPPLPKNLSTDFIDKISSKLERLDPQAEIILNMTCPHCNHSFITAFFAEDFILQEISVRQKQNLDQEIHWLAFYYHWSENEILSLSMKRRKKYVKLINRALSGGEW
jgi:hypothetical protein